MGYTTRPDNLIFKIKVQASVFCDVQHKIGYVFGVHQARITRHGAGEIGGDQ